MAGPTVEELLQAGGQRRKPPPQEQVGGAETYVNRAVGMIPGATRLTDAIAAMALEAGSSGGARATLTPEARAELQAMGEDVPEDPGLVDRYREVRDRRAERTELGSQQNPWAGRAGALTGFGLSLFAPLPKASGTGLGAAVKTGAGYGAFQGLTEGGADLTRGEFGEAALDTLKGAAAGGALGAGVHGAMRLGQKGMQALRGARQEVLAQEMAAAQEAAQKGQDELAAEVGKHRELVGKARGMMEKEFAGREKVQGQAMEMNKANDARAIRSQERAQRVLERARRREATPEDPNTVVLEGMSGKAHQAQQTRSDKALQYRREMGEPDLSTKVAGAREDYIQRMPEALADPAAARRLFIERYLKQRYPNDPGRVERLMRERIGPGGEVLPRAAPVAPPEPAPQPQLSAGQEQLPLLPAPEAQPARLPSGLTPPPAVREGATGMPYGKNLRPEPQPPQSDASRVIADAKQRFPDAFDGPPPDVSRLVRDAERVNRGDFAGRTLGRADAEQSMAAPKDMPVPPVSATRTAALPTVPGRPALPAGAPAPQPTVADDIQDVTRLAGPGDVAPLAAERAAAREQDAFRAVGRAGYEGVKAGQSTLGAIFGGLGGITREALRDPAVKARVLAAARLHVLARINPALYARVGAQLQGGGHQRAAEHLLARKDPEYREARAKAAEQVAGLTDQQLVDLFASAGQPQ